MKKFYVIIGQTKDENKYPTVFEGWYNNKKEALNVAKKQEQLPTAQLYGVSYTLWEVIKFYVLRIKHEKVGLLIKDLK